MSAHNVDAPPGVNNERLVELFAAVRRGNIAAFDEMYELIRRPLMAYCLALTTSSDDAKDLFSTTVLKVYEARDKFLGGNFEAWIFTIARNSARSDYRNKKRRPTVEVKDDLPVPENEGLEEDEMQIIHKAVADLPVEFKTVIMLKYFAEMSVVDIAETEGITPELVKTRLYRARQRLAETLRHIVEV